MTEKHEEKFVQLRVVQSLFEGQRMQALLQAAEIPTMLNSYGDTAMDGLYQAQKGWGEIRVPESRKAEAEKILEENAPQTTGMPDEEIEQQALSAQDAAEKITTPASFKWILWVILFVLGMLVAYFLWELFS
jgi:hypothetical protein